MAELAEVVIFLKKPSFREINALAVLGHMAIDVSGRPLIRRGESRPLPPPRRNLKITSILQALLRKALDDSLHLRQFPARGVAQL